MPVAGPKIPWSLLPTTAESVSVALYDPHRAEVLFLKEYLPQMSHMTLETLKENARAFEETGMDVRLLCACYCKMLGSALYGRKDNAGARAHYIRGVKEILGEDVVLPIRDFRKRYMKLGPVEYIDLGALYNNIALTYAGERNFERALFWLEEQRYVFYCQMLKATPTDQEWKSLNTTAAEFYIIGSRSFKRRGDIFESLNNTGTASWSFFEGNTHCGLVTHGSCPEVDKVQETSLLSYRRVSHFRHPDASLAHTIKITEPSLQIRGSWQKKRIGGAKISSRMGASLFVWSGRLYVLGGQRTSKEDRMLYDFYYLDLNDERLQSWHQLPSIPEPPLWQSTSPFEKPGSWNAVVVDDAVWLFVGIRQLAKFDLQSEKWTFVKTTIDGDSWPYKHRLHHFGTAVHKGLIYVFGGVDQEHPIGNNLLLALDTRTLKWKRLSGTSAPKVNKSLPGLRTFAQCWVHPVQEKLYVLYGCAQRTAIEIKLLFSGQDYNYSDLWSYHIPTSTWLEERLHGNPPCPRTEFGSTYSPVLDRTFVFGGYNCFLPSSVADHTLDEMMFAYSYFADTFMWTPKTNTWSQVMTHGFPTHRAQASLATDSDTGRVYLFGGYSSTEFSGVGSAATRNHSEVWQLCVDLPGGELDKVDLEDEARLAALGVDRRCFNCGEVGKFKKCGGTCGGKASFCGKTCLEDAWAEHKQKHGCKKR